ncbi:hypothetical protein SERLADRAFT_470136 [Serpula lacrymans var. lacrymans S7.9]|uniref:Uncharacterized protein n=1 Tax=Serpula lacrymans var. lacrymans (strain S7.9) TaxID=578457 RepID=F8NYW8_SERL9|nr:uncharacterized protein SERLADRAFT_470136 [Serpula lacrymans var. lacrymans S7.9]EGO23789.1 hypothetical protein SERLADRAFT_470136 [Serpula lacrymans var. lacrymans S7.9]
MQECKALVKARVCYQETMMAFLYYNDNDKATWNTISRNSEDVEKRSRVTPNREARVPRAGTEKGKR